MTRAKYCKPGPDGICRNCGQDRTWQDLCDHRDFPGKSKKRVRRAKSRPIATTGLGDVLESSFRRVGIKAAVTWVTAKTGSSCNCEKRRDALNKLVPFCRDRACWRLAVSHWKFYIGPKLQARGKSLTRTMRWILRRS